MKAIELTMSRLPVLALIILALFTAQPAMAGETSPTPLPTITIAELPQSPRPQGNAQIIAKGGCPGSQCCCITGSTKQCTSNPNVCAGVNGGVCGSGC